MAAADRDAAVGRTATVKADSESGDDPCCMRSMIGRSHGELGRFTATQFR